MRRLLAALCLLLPTSAAFAADLVRSYSYYTLDATTLDELGKQLETRGPRVETSGHKHPGATRMQFTTQTTYSHENERCRVSRARTTLKVEIILPRWLPRHKPEADMRIIWDTLAADIRRHESQHVDIAKNYARQLEGSIRTSGSDTTCEETAVRVKQITTRVMEQHDRAQQQFDRVESINFDDRFQRLLDYRLSQMNGGHSRNFGNPGYNR